MVAGFERGFPDFVARPDISTLVALPWEPHVAICLCDLYDGVSGEPYGADPRGALRRVLAAYAELGPTPSCWRPSSSSTCASPTRARPRAGAPTRARTRPPYTVGHLADPRGVLDDDDGGGRGAGPRVIAAAHEYGRSQYEINLVHGEALAAADRAFRFKELVKELASREGLLATFMGKPFNGDEGSGLHIHVSLAGEDGANAFADPTARTASRHSPASSSPGSSSTPAR